MTACLRPPGSPESLGQKALPSSHSPGVLWQCLALQCSRWEGISGLQAPGALLASGSRMVQVGARTLSLVCRAKRSSRTSAPGCPTVLLGQDPRCAAEPRGVLTGRNESLASRDEEHFLGPPPNLQCCWGLPLNLEEQEPAWAGVCHEHGPERPSLGWRVSARAALLLLLLSTLRGLQRIQGSQLPPVGSREGEPGHAPPPGYSLSAGCNLPDRQLGSFISASINF